MKTMTEHNPTDDGTEDASLDGEDIDDLITRFDDIADTSLAALDDATQENIETRDVVRMINFLDNEVEQMLQLLYDPEHDVDALLYDILIDHPEVPTVEVARFFDLLTGYTEEELSWALKDAGIIREVRGMVLDEVEYMYGFDEFDPETFEEDDQ